MTAKTIASFVTGVVFLALLLGVGCFMAFRTDARPVPDQAMFIFRAILALAAAGFATVLLGFLEINGSVLGWQLRAAGSLAVFLLVYLINPPVLIKNQIPVPKKARKIRIPPVNSN